MPKEYRYHVFVDFWNYVLCMKEHNEHFQTDWKTFPKILTREAGNLVDPGALAIYAGMNVYGSYDSSKNTKLKHWATSVLDTMPGVHAVFKELTKKKSHPHCPDCHQKVETCPSCASDMRGKEEKGIDTRLAGDLVSMAWEQAYDVAILVTADQDFVPAAEYLQGKGIKVIHGGFPPYGMLLRQKCWGALDVRNFSSDFKR